MDKVIHYFHRWIPAYWALLIIAPLIKDYVPDIYYFVKESNINAIIVLVSWLVLYEVVFYHVVAPISIAFVCALFVGLGVYLILYLVFPKIRDNKLFKKIFEDEKIKDGSREAVASELIKKKLGANVDIKDDIALSVAYTLGEKSKYFKEREEGRESTDYYSLAITLAVVGILYFIFSPDLSMIGVSSDLAASILIMSGFLLSFLGWFMGFGDKDNKLEAAILELIEQENNIDKGNQPNNGN